MNRLRCIAFLMGSALLPLNSMSFGASPSAASAPNRRKAVRAVFDEFVRERMKLVLAATMAALLISRASAVEAGPPGTQDLDRQQITKLIEALDETWNKHDMRAHSALFHEDGIWIAWTGEVISGRAAFETRLTELHKTVFKQSFHKGLIEEIRFVGPDAAVVRGYGTVTGNEPTPDKMERYRNLIVVTRRDGAWKLGWGQKTRFRDSTPDPYPER